ncbi:winged helix-turn-helix transcriptional regulator [Vallitaleaceae bacterium 9-2]
MTNNKSLYKDYEYAIMQEIEANNKVTQRELSRNMGVSLGTVNVLMNKMVREGLIKMTQVSQKQVLYMLTPFGMMAKAKKTVSYLKAHYKAIEMSKQMIKVFLRGLAERYQQIYVYIQDKEIREVIELAFYELNREDLLIDYVFIDTIDKMNLDKQEEVAIIYLKTDPIEEYINLSKEISCYNLLDYL